MTTHHYTVREQSEIMFHGTPGCLDILTFADTLAICFTGITCSDGYVWQKKYTVYKENTPTLLCETIFVMWNVWEYVFELVPISIYHYDLLGKIQGVPHHSKTRSTIGNNIIIVGHLIADVAVWRSLANLTWPYVLHFFFHFVRKCLFCSNK